MTKDKRASFPFCVPRLFALYSLFFRKKVKNILWKPIIGNTIFNNLLIIIKI